MSGASEEPHARGLPGPLAAVRPLRVMPGTGTSTPRPAAFSEQALAQADALYNLARYLARDQDDAEDLVQETFARAFAGADRFEPGTNLRAWLFRILRNAFLDRARRDRRVTAAGDLEDAGEAASAGDGWLRDDRELEAMRRLVGGEIEAALRSLSEEARTAVLLDLEGFSEAEAALVLGCAAGTVKSRLSRARAALRERLGEYARGRP